MSHATTSTETTADIFTVPDNTVAIRTDGMSEPVYFRLSEIDTVLDKEGDIWLQNELLGLFYLPLSPWDEEPEEADTTLAEIENGYGLADINVPLPEEPAAVEPEPLHPAAHQRGDITVNRLSGRDALVLDRQYQEHIGWVYTVIEKGFVYPAGCCPQQPGAALFMESLLDATGEHFEEDEILLLTLAYSLPLN